MLGLVPGMFPLRKVGLCKEKGRKEGEDNNLQRRDVLACGHMCLDAFVHVVHSLSDASMIRCLVCVVCFKKMIYDTYRSLCW